MNTRQRAVSHISLGQSYINIALFLHVICIHCIGKTVYAATLARVIHWEFIRTHFQLVFYIVMWCLLSNINLVALLWLRVLTLSPNFDCLVCLFRFLSMLYGAHYSFGAFRTHTVNANSFATFFQYSTLNSCWTFIKFKWNEMKRYLPNRLSFSWLTHDVETFELARFHSRFRMIHQWPRWQQQLPA